jgi:ABC-type bacteriocin/lantibiotic exporter with double-glycine peptidase domain
VLRFHGVPRPLDVQRLANPVQGTAPDTIEAVLRAAGLPVVSGSMRGGDLEHFTRCGRPVICPLSLSGGHWVVIAEANRNYVTFHDPLVGSRWMWTDDFADVWTDTTRNGHTFARWGIAAGPPL